MNEDLAYFLGLWIAEGSLEREFGRISITCGDSEIGEFLMSGKVCGIQFTPSSGRSDQWRANSYELVEMMSFLKMPLVKAPQKWLPDFVWSGTRDNARHFLSGMFDGDGYVSTKRNKLGYTTASAQLAKDLQLLLTNFGVISRLTKVTSEPTKKVRVSSDQYRVEIFGKNASKMKEILMLRIARKQEALDAIAENCFSRRDGLPALDLLSDLKAILPKKKHPVLDEALQSSRRHGVNTTYETLEKILSEFSDLSNTPEYQVIEKAVSDHYYWDTVESIESGESLTYDFTIPETHSFWSNGFISHNTPKSFNHLYELWSLGQKAEMTRIGRWRSWQFTTAMSPFIPAEELEAARRDMDEKSFQQEFEASFLSMSGLVYYPFDRSVHVGEYPFNPALPIWVGQDFNIDPMSSVILQPQPSGEVWAVDEIVRFSSNTQDVCDELERRFWRYQKQITIYPDPAGGARQHARGESDLDIFRERGFRRIKYRRKHPFVADRVNAVNRMLRSGDGQVRLRINHSCRSLIESLEQTIYKPGSRDIDKSGGLEHSTDALGYPVEIEFPLRKIEIAGVSL